MWRGFFLVSNSLKKCLTLGKPSLEIQICWSRFSLELIGLSLNLARSNNPVVLAGLDMPVQQDSNLHLKVESQASCL